MDLISRHRQFASARIAMLGDSVPLRVIAPAAAEGETCVTHLARPAFGRNMPIFFQLPENIDGFDNLDQIDVSLVFSREFELGSGDDILSMFNEIPLRDRALDAKRVRGNSEETDQLAYSLSCDEDNVWLVFELRGNGETRQKTAIEIVDSLPACLREPMESVFKRACSKIDSTAKQRFLDATGRVAAGVFAGKTRLSAKVPATSSSSESISEWLLGFHESGDRLSLSATTAKYRYESDREIAFQFAKDWSLHTLGGYPEKFNPLIRPNREFGRYGWILPIFHLTHAPLDYDSGVRLDIVHRQAGSFMELHSFEGREKIEQAAEILRSAIPSFATDLEWWDGKPEDRWLD